MKIDYVVPMIFDDDEQLRKLYRKRYGSPLPRNDRFRSWGTEHLLVMCIRKYMPWIDTIFIILAQESQKRDWMADEGIRVVFHRDFIPEEYLPTFNSCTIEMFIPFIDGLSEHFIYGNDDMFPLSSLKETDFFVDGLPCISFEKRRWPANKNTFHDKCIRQQKMLSDYFGKKTDGYWLHGGHSLSPLVKSECQSAFKAFENEILKGITPNRSETSYNHYLYMLWASFSGMCVNKPFPRKYTSTLDALTEILGYVYKDDVGVLCINDSDHVEDFDHFSSAVHDAIEKKLTNRKNDMEYKIWVTYHDDAFVSQYGLRNDEHHILFASHKDAGGENINYLNPVYSEMVTMWYVWKNQLRSDYVGFEHYRRHLNVVRMPKDGACQVYQILNFNDKTVYEQYAQWHNHEDMDAVLSVLEEKYGKDNKYSDYIIKSHLLIAKCTYLMKWDDFCTLCDFLFPILEAYTKKCGFEGLGTLEDWHNKAVNDFAGDRPEYQRRVVSFLAERLISAWIYNEMKYDIGVDVAIVNYNTTELTSAAISSLNKVMPGCHVVVFDNSDKEPFENIFDNVDVIDNTKGKVINFNKMLSKYPDREIGDRNKSNFGSAKHCRSVDLLFGYLPDGFVLMDSDVLVTRSFAKIIDTNKAMSGTYGFKDGVALIHPFLCWINVPMLKANKIRYFNGDKMWALTNKSPNNRYDTGSWVYEEIVNKHLPWNQIDIWSYIIHLGHGSWRGSKSKEWLKQNEHLLK